VALAIVCAWATVASEAFGVVARADAQRAATSLAKQLKLFLASREWIVAR
jgi:hypothetical protein